MKRIYLLLLACIAFAATPAFAQNDKKENPHADDSLPYMQDPNMPPFEIKLLDSATTFNSATIPAGKPTVFFFFGAECGHCESAFETLQKSWDSLSGADFYMFSFSPIYQIKGFAKKYHLDDYKNIKIVGMDSRMFFTGYYGVRGVPFIVVYDKDRKVVQAWHTHVPVKELYDAIQRKSHVKMKKKKK